MANPNPTQTLTSSEFCSGLVLLASFVILGAGLGASGGIAHIGAALSMSVSPSHTLSSEYFGKWGSAPLDYYLVFMFAGTFVGALFSALLANRARIQVERGTAFSVSRRLGYALAGGVLVGFASRLAQGCTSGQALEWRRAAVVRQSRVYGLSLRQRLCCSLVCQEAMA